MSQGAAKNRKRTYRNNNRMKSNNRNILLGTILATVFLSSYLHAEDKRLILFASKTHKVTEAVLWKNMDSFKYGDKYSAGIIDERELFIKVDDVSQISYLATITECVGGECGEFHKICSKALKCTIDLPEATLTSSVILIDINQDNGGDVKALTDKYGYACHNDIRAGLYGYQPEIYELLYDYGAGSSEFINYSLSQSECASITKSIYDDSFYTWPLHYAPLVSSTVGRFNFAIAKRKYNYFLGSGKYSESLVSVDDYLDYMNHLRESVGYPLPMIIEEIEGSLLRLNLLSKAVNAQNEIDKSIKIIDSLMKTLLQQQQLLQDKSYIKRLDFLSQNLNGIGRQFDRPEQEAIREKLIFYSDELVKIFP
ncbi:hypothetical protein [Ferrimonas kyonanensis]|uniref:hypothetical protein n=1 Tax=Ferrimonas kyonanensis TaxID=364763 RepID=UPI0004134A5D|nr:hypothetical protein [Ferrimonas kyonanensis]